MGKIWNGSYYNFGLIQYDFVSNLNNSFGTNGVVSFSAGTQDDISYSVSEQTDGKLLLAGYAYNRANDDFAIVRFMYDGSIDPTFETNGIVQTSFVASNYKAFGVAIQQNNRILLVGYSFDSSDDNFSIVRYL